MPDLLRQPKRDITSLTAAGAYDGDPVYRAATARQPDPTSGRGYLASVLSVTEHGQSG